MEKILVTGADGFIGSHLTEELVKLGYNVKAFIYYNSFNFWGWIETLPEDIKDKIEIFSGDIRDPNGVRIAMEGCDLVFHLAALIAIPFSYHSPDSYVDTNIKGTLNILQAAKVLGTPPAMSQVGWVLAPTCRCLAGAERVTLNAIIVGASTHPTNAKEVEQCSLPTTTF